MEERKGVIDKVPDAGEGKQHPVWLIFVYVSLLTWTLWNLFKTWN